MIELRQISSGQAIGTVSVTIALGFSVHQRFLDPNSPLSATLNAPPPVAPPAVAPKPVQHAIDDPQTHRPRSHHRRGRRKRTDWMQRATAFGWKPPGYVDPEWRDRARQKGWNPPPTTVYSSIAVACEPPDCQNLRDCQVQTVPAAISSSSSSSSASLLRHRGRRSAIVDDDDDIFGLIDLLNEPKQPQRLAMTPVEAVCSIRGNPMSLSPAISLFDKQPPSGPPPLDLSDDSELDESLHEISRQWTSERRPLTPIPQTSSKIEAIPNPNDFTRKLLASLGSSDDDEEEDVVSRVPTPRLRSRPIPQADNDASSSDEDTNAAARRLQKIVTGDPSLAYLFKLYRDI
jgi:hypothetical protein